MERAAKCHFSAMPELPEVETVRRGLQPATMAAVKELNSRSTALIDAIDAFEKVGRSRIRVAAPPPAAP